MEITDSSSFFDSLMSNSVVIADFYSDTCAPCQRMLKILPNLENELSELAVICKVNIEGNGELKDLYNVRGIPTFIFFKNAQEVHRHTGIMTLAAIKHKVMELQ